MTSRFTDWSIPLCKNPHQKFGWIPGPPSPVGNKPANSANAWSRKAGNRARTFNTWKRTTPITVREPGQEESNLRCASYFRRGNDAVAAWVWEAAATLRNTYVAHTATGAVSLPAPAMGWAAKVPAAAQATVE